MCVCLPGLCPGSSAGLALVLVLVLVLVLSWLSVCLPGPLLLFILLLSGPLRTRGVFILGAFYILIIVFSAFAKGWLTHEGFLSFLIWFWHGFHDGSG